MSNMQRSSSRFRLSVCIALTFAAGLILCPVPATKVRAQQRQQILPAVDVAALDGHRVSLPHDLSPATVIIVGFSKASADATTAWEIPVRTKLAGGNVGFYDVAVLASVPRFLHGWISSSLKSKVPPVLQGRFLPVFADEAAWKQVCGYDPKAQDAAYVLIVSHSGDVLWRSHEPYSESRFADVSQRAKTVSGL